MIDEETVFTTKIYLVKIKVGHDFKNEDLLWAIGHKGGDNIDFEDFKNIVVVLNNKGLWNPVLSDTRVTWKSLKNSADCKALGHIGKPILLLEEVLTFKQILEFAYSQSILTDPKGKEILAAKDEDLMAVDTKPSVSLTLEQASGSGPSKADIVKQAMQNSKLLFSGLFDSERQLITTGEFSNFPAPVPVVPLGNTPSNSEHDGEGSPGTMDQTQPGTSFDHQVKDHIVHTHGMVPGVGSEVEIVGETLASGPLQQGYNDEDNFDPSRFNVDDVDNELALLDDPTETDILKKNSRYKSIAKTLRNSLSFSCLTVQKLTKEVDSKDMQLRELSSFSSSQIIDALKPELAKVNLLADQVRSLTETVNALDAKIATDIASVRTQVTDVVSQVDHNATLAKDQSNNIVRHLSTFGIVDVGASFDIPGSISSVYRILNEEIAPVFRAGHVVSQVSLYGQTGTINQVVAPPTTPASQLATFGTAPPVPAAAATKGNGLLVPPSNPDLEKNYLPLSNSSRQLGPQSSLSGTKQLGPSPQHVSTTPGPQASGNPRQSTTFSGGALAQQHTTPSPAHPHAYSAPPPPFKRTNVDRVGTSAVRSLFGPYSRPPPQPAQYYTPQQSTLVNKARNMYQMPPPSLQQANQHGNPGIFAHPNAGPGAAASGVPPQHHQS